MLMKKKTGSGIVGSGIVLSAVAVVLVLGGVFLLRHHVIAARASVAGPVQEPWALHVVKVRKGTISEGFPALATLSTQDEISIKPQLTGVITAIGPRAGKRVKKGDLLVRIDTTEIENNLAALRASLVSAKANVDLQSAELKRTRKLKKRGYATPEQRDKLVAALKGAQGLVGQLKAQIAAAKTRIAYGTVRSPVSGSIVVRNQTRGDLAAPGKEIYRINAASGAKVMVTVPQSVLATVKPGSAIILSYGSKQQSVKLTRISPSLDALSMGLAEADIAHIPFGLPSGARVPARVILNKHPDVMIVPLSALAISADGQTAVVFKLDKASAKELPRLRKLEVKLISKGAEGVAISGDLAKGDEVVSAHESVLLRLVDGDQLRAFPLAQASNANREGH